jgi:hypothetical protein
MIRILGFLSAAVAAPSTAREIATLMQAARHVVTNLLIKRIGITPCESATAMEVKTTDIPHATKNQRER